LTKLKNLQEFTGLVAGARARRRHPSFAVEAINKLSTGLDKTEIGGCGVVAAGATAASDSVICRRARRAAATRWRHLFALRARASLELARYK
jgi:hypothetical protein